MRKLTEATVIGFFLLSVALLSSSKAQGAKEFSNPILAGFYPDPSICRVDSDFYLVNSTFAYFPGITVFHSRDLVHWKLIGYVLDRAEQLNLDGQGVSRGIFAPAIRHHNGLFYVTCTLVDIGGNFVATASNPAGPWSNPVWLPQVNGIDPSLFFDNDGKSYIIYNSIPPDNKPLYDGHRTLRMYEFDAESLKVVGVEHLLVNGGTDIRMKPVWIEAPHIFKKGEVYFLIAAEGGTAENHSEVVFRSTNVAGPYMPFERNPILTQRDLDPKRAYPITCTGHADLVQAPDGNWWSVFLGCRPYEGDYYNTGRETFLAPVQWIDDWPVINPDHREVQYHYPYPATPSQENGHRLMGGNLVVRDDFRSAKLDIAWEFLRTPHEQWYSLAERRGCLAVQLRPETCSGSGNPSFLVRRQQHAVGSASVSLDFSPHGENEKAGLVVFQNEHRFYYLCKSAEGSQPVIQLYRSADGSTPGETMQLLMSHPIGQTGATKTLSLKIEAHGNAYSFHFAVGGEVWQLLKENVDTKHLSTKDAGGFVGCVYALYATSLGKPSGSKAYYDWFEYVGNDEVYRR